MRYIAICALLMLYACVPARGEKPVIGPLDVSPRVVYPTYFKQSADGSIVEARTQPLVVKDAYDWKNDPFIIFSMTGGFVILCVGAILLATKEQNYARLEGFRRRVSFPRKARHNYEDSLLPLLKQLSLSEGTGGTHGRVGRLGHGEYSPSVQARHPATSALGSWAQHLRTTEAERSLRRISGTDEGCFN